MSIHFGMSNIPELDHLTPEERKQIERTSAFLGGWDWWTWLPTVVVWTLAALMNPLLLHNLGGQEAIGLVVGFVLGIIVFVISLLARINHHARRIAASWKESPVAVEDASDPIVPPRHIATWRRILLWVGTSAGPGLLIGGIYAHSWELGALGGLLLYAGVAAITSYDVCIACHKVTLRFGSGIRLCQRCGSLCR